MKKFSFSLVLIIFVQFIAVGQNDFTSTMNKSREDHIAYLLSDTSFLKAEERANIISLNYFAPDTNYIVNAIFQKIKGKKFEMKTNTPRRPIYRQYGIVTFTLHDTTISLPVYESVSLLKRNRKKYKNYLFLPIKDATSFQDPLESNGAGRYLELEKTKEKTMELDFNELFNPYCAYTDRFSCPITPEANIIDIRIEAGEKATVRKEGGH
jgi:uncharacterized protein (DUF1684 family)